METRGQDGEALRERVRALALAEGFDVVRFAGAAPMLDAREVARARLAEGALAGMSWMTEEWLERATDPGAFLAGAKSVVLVALAYGASAVGTQSSVLKPQSSPARGRVAQYARGRDYHRVFEKKLRRMARGLREEFGAAARPTVDYGPLLERPLAALSGMGWLGKSTMLLVPGMGPWVLLGAIATDLELRPDEPLKKACGSCTRCVVSCPTGAISPEGGVLDARLCISYHTIENRGPIPRELRAKFGDWVFGCDECLDACPVGSKREAGYPEFEAASVEDSHPVLAGLLALDEEGFRERFRGRPIMRAKRDGLVRNACVALGNVGTVADIVTLKGALDDTSALVRGHAAWALGELGRRLEVEVRALLEARLAIEQDSFAREELVAALSASSFQATQLETAHG